MSLRGPWRGSLHAHHSPFPPCLLRTQDVLAARERRVGWGFGAALSAPSVTEEETWACQGPLRGELLLPASSLRLGAGGLPGRRTNSEEPRFSCLWGLPFG